MSNMNDEVDLVLKEAVNNKRDNEVYLKKLGVIKNETVLPVLLEIHEDVFNSTDCLACANCCRTTPPLITREDVNRISRRINMSPKQFIREYVISEYSGEMMFRVVPCTFLSSENTCTIYDVRPEACRRYPHTNEKEYQKRISLNISNTLVCPAAFKILDRLQNVIPLPA